MKFTVTMDVNVEQALTLKAMFDYWTQLGCMGSSRTVSFYCDGDGNFRPNCIVCTDENLPELTNELRQLAVVEDEHGNRKYDFDPIGWKLLNIK